MDLHTAVAASMLPVSRARGAAAFKENRRLEGRHALKAVLQACEVPPSDWGSALDRACRKADEALTGAASARAEPIAWFDPRYPALLDCIPDPPPVLWVRGAVDVLPRAAVAIVGSRGATEYALQVGERLGAELGSAAVVVASGLARGVDSAAHRGCLSAGGFTVAVLGSGLDRIYPAEHRDLADRICGNGLLVSELGPGAQPLPEHFPLRNRIISGISLAVVIVEASDKSGSLITARYALEQGRDVMAVPGNVLSGRNRGSHGLLKDGAKVVETADDILEEFGWRAGRPAGYSGSKVLNSDPLLARMEPGEVYRLDELAALTGTPGPRLLPRLMELELRGRVVTTSGGRFARVEPAEHPSGLLT
jgi:DNA processing protein